MSRTHVLFSQYDVTRALNAFKQAGVPTAGVCFTKDGFCVLVGEGDQLAEVQNDEVETWIKKNARKS